jgi:hypothetical protein
MMGSADFRRAPAQDRLWGFRSDAANEVIGEFRQIIFRDGCDKIARSRVS